MTMADKNLHDIKIDDLDNPKKTPLKNILTLLALLFIILVISVAITRLILNTDEEGLNESNNSMNSAIVETDSEKDTDNTTANTAGLVAAAAAGTMLANGTSLTERNVSTGTKNASTTETKKDDDSSKEKDHGSKIKVPLRTHQPVKTKELTSPKKHTPIPKKPKPVVTKAPSNSGKQYIDKVVSSSKKSSSNRSHLGEKRPGYYIKVGTFKDTSTAVSKIKKTGLDYILIKPKNDKTMTRVLIGPFKSNWGAKQHLPSIKNNIAEGAYITRID
jgi:cell division septation protein DedD